MALITLEQAATHLRITGSEYADDLELKIEQASALVIQYLKREDHEWTVETDPADDLEFAIVQAAILEVLANLWGDRGDREKPSDGPVTDRVKRALSMMRDPSLA